MLGNLAAIALIGHLAYIPFQAIGRHAFSSIPLLVLFALYGLGVLQGRVVQEKLQRSQGLFARVGCTLAAACGVTLALLIFSCDTFTHAGESQETGHVLHAGEVACRSFDLASSDADSPLQPGNHAVVSSILLMVDCDMEPSALADISLRLNGHLLPGPMLPLNCFNGEKYFLFDTMAEHAAFLRTRVQNLRQWRAVVIPSDSDLLSRDGLNELELINNGRRDITVFGDTGSRFDKPLLLPSPDYFASDLMLISPTSKESRIKTLSPVSGLLSRSYLKSKSGGAGAVKPLADTLRLRLGVLTTGDAAQQDLSNVTAPATSTLDFKLPAQKFPLVARAEGGIRVSKGVLRAIGVVPCELDLTGLEAMDPHCTQLAVSLTGRARTISGPGRLGVAAGLSNTQGLYQGLGQFADFVDVSRKASAVAGEDGWTPFELNDVVPLSKLGGINRVRKLSLCFSPCPHQETCYGAGKQCSDIEVKDLHVVVRPLRLIEMASKTLSVY
jgi:hypothetical protein